MSSPISLPFSLWFGNAVFCFLIMFGCGRLLGTSSTTSTTEICSSYTNTEIRIFVFDIQKGTYACDASVWIDAEEWTESLQPSLHASENIPCSYEGTFPKQGTVTVHATIAEREQILESVPIGAQSPLCHYITQVHTLHVF